MTFFRCAALAAVLALPFTAGAADHLSLTDAFQRAIAADPSLPAAGARVDAALAGERQSGASPNPSLGLEVENFAGSGALNGAVSLMVALLPRPPLPRNCGVGACVVYRSNDTAFHQLLSAMQFGSIFASRLASETSRSCSHNVALKSATRRYGVGRSSSATSLQQTSIADACRPHRGGT